MSAKSLIACDADRSRGGIPAIYLRDGYFPDNAFVCEECRDPVQAQKLLDLYQCIIANIEWQVMSEADSSSAVSGGRGGISLVFNRLICSY